MTGALQLLAVFMLVMFGFAVGGGLQAAALPTLYAEGYCTALGGVRVSDEVCDVGGNVVAVQGWQ